MYPSQAEAITRAIKLLVDMEAHFHACSDHWNIERVEAIKKDLQGAVPGTPSLTFVQPDCQRFRVT